MKRLWRSLAMTAALTTPALGQGGVCDKIEEPLAYNACLATHGPKAGAVRGEPEPAGAGGPMAAISGRGRVKGLLMARKTRRGKMEMEFDVGGK